MARLLVHLRPSAGAECVVGRYGDGIKAAVAAAPEKGRANAALARLVAGALGVPAHAVRIAAGLGSRRKTLAIEGISQEAVDDWLGRLPDAKRNEGTRT